MALDEFIRESNCGLVRMSDIEPHEPEFLWFPYIRRNTVNDCRGNGGSSKTSMSFALAAAITNGKQPAQMPGRLNIDRPCAVIYLGMEDDQPEYRAMLDRQGADSRNVLMPSGHIPSLGEIATIETMIKRFDVALLIIDPIQALLPVGVDMNRSNEVRPILEGLRTTCRNTGCTALMLEHLNKATKASNTYRGSGSMDFFNASRSVLITGWTPDGERACGHLKSNGAAYGPAILFDIDHTGRFVWKGSDPTISGEDIITTRPRELRSNVHNPYTILINSLVENGAWEGTASEAVSLAASFDIHDYLSSEGFGKAIKGTYIPGVRCTSRRASRGTVYRLEQEGNHAG